MLFNKYIFCKTELNLRLYINVYNMEENTNADTTVDECQELKNIKYKTMLLNGAPLHETKSSNDISNLEKFLEDEKISNSNEPWCKLNKTIKK